MSNRFTRVTQNLGTINHGATGVFNFPISAKEINLRYLKITPSGSVAPWTISVCEKANGTEKFLSAVQASGAKELLVGKLLAYQDQDETSPPEPKLHVRIKNRDTKNRTFSIAFDYEIAGANVVPE